MVVVVALALAAVFGGGSQYLGSMSGVPWAHEIDPATGTELGPSSEGGPLSWVVSR
jgi:hypothetical protein